jgi:histidinol-phosphatase
MMATTHTRLDFLHTVVEETNDRLLHYFNTRSFSVSQKANTSPVTQADVEIETMIRKVAREQFPNLNIVGEECGSEAPSEPQKSGLRLIIDPIDATANFIRGVPIFGTLLAFEENGVVTDGLISAPAIGATWWASRGSGAFYNGQRMQVSAIDSVSEACVFHGALYGYEAQGLPGGFHAFLAKTKRQRGFGDFYAPMLVAMGAGECCVDANLQCWDMAPIQVILEEAGGRFSDFSGNASVYSHHMVCSNGQVHEACLASLRNG